MAGVVGACPGLGAGLVFCKSTAAHPTQIGPDHWEGPCVTVPCRHPLPELKTGLTAPKHLFFYSGTIRCRNRSQMRPWVRLCFAHC